MPTLSLHEMRLAKKLLVLGGAGFVGSNICNFFYEQGWNVTAVDGLMERTEAAVVGFKRLHKGIKCIDRRIKAPRDIEGLLSEDQLVVDAIGWTSHWGGDADPFYDLELNLIPHVALAKAFEEVRPALTIYLGSTHQYGIIETEIATENSAQTPLDAQGIHKVAAERHLALAANKLNMRLISCRFGNTFGRGMPLFIKDIGLIGDFIRQSLRDEKLVVYGEGRRRTLYYAADLAKSVFKLAFADIPAGFTPLNLEGTETSIHALADLICAAAGRGNVEIKPIDAPTASIDVGDRKFSYLRAEELCGEIEITPLKESIESTVNDVKNRLGV